MERISSLVCGSWDALILPQKTFSTPPHSGLPRNSCLSHCSTSWASWKFASFRSFSLEGLGTPLKMMRHTLKELYESLDPRGTPLAPPALPEHRDLQKVYSF